VTTTNKGIIMDNDPTTTAAAIARAAGAPPIKGRAAIQQELESELRGLLMSAKLHGFRLVMTPDGGAMAVDEEQVVS
jgi:hypothetical protein